MPKTSAVGGSELVIKCPVSGYPIDKIHWERGEKCDEIRTFYNLLFYDKSKTTQMDKSFLSIDVKELFQMEHS
jgi:hypothetical protein